ncbi:MAG: hypothetical protein JWO67_1565 [Streptosporangiaceae bacterium]|nr:hypothetical protein [Streptosporangiaceae bacterium]
MVQLTYYPTTATAAQPRWEPQTQDVHTLRHGYNLADLDRLAKAACRRAKGIRSLEFHVRYETAWSGIAEALCSAPEPPSPSELIAAGGKAINDEARAVVHHAGISEHTWQPMAGYERYWQYAGRPTPSPEVRVVEQLALWQIWYRLPEEHRSVFLALAAFGDPDAAAASLGMDYHRFTFLLSRARCAFLNCWHEGEKPSRLWRYTRRWRRDGLGHNGRPRITVSQLEEIRDRRAEGETISRIAADYGVQKSWLAKLLRGQTRPAPDLEEGAA